MPRLHLCGMSDKTRNIAAGSYAERVRTLAQCPGVLPSRLAYFRGYLSRPYIPPHIDRELSAALLVFFPETGETVAETGVSHHISATQEQVKIVGAVSGTFWGGIFANKSTVPGEVAQLYSRALVLHKHHSRLHALMCDAAQAGKRKRAHDLAIEIMEEIIPELDKIYDAARHWAETGSLPAGRTRDEVVKDTIEKMKRIQRLREKRSRLKGYLKKGEREVWMDGVKSWEGLTPKSIMEIENEVLEGRVEERQLMDELGLKD